MDKVKKFLEAYVQWLAIALGVGFLGWMLYSYVVVKPVSSSVGSTSNAAPGDINTLIWSQVGDPLKTQLDSHAVPTQIGSTHDFPSEATAHRGLVPSTVVLVTPVPITPIPLPEGADLTPDQANPQHIAKITSLPTAPALINLTVSGGHSNVPAPLPALAAGAVAPPPAAPVQAVDRNWRTVAGIIHVADLAKSFAKAGIAPGSAFSSTAVLRVVMTREERKSDGSWGSDTVIDPLDINPLPPLPPINAAFADQKSYLEDFAEKNFLPIARPPFYQVLQGDLWFEPGTPNPNASQAVIDDGYDPKDPGAYAGDINKLLPSEQKLVTDAKARQAARDAKRARNQNYRNNTPLPGSGNGIDQPPQLPGAGGGQNLVNDPQRPLEGQPMFAPSDNGVDPNTGVPSGMVPSNGQPNGQPGFQPNFQPNVQPGFQPGQAVGDAALPTGSFDPSQQPDFKVWVHDATVQAGKTYRYQLKYIISNPVARTSNLCNPPSLAKQFYIESDPSAWTDPVSVESDTNFYAVEIKHGIHFDVFKWKDGIWQMQSVTANVGDMVGNLDTNATTGVKTDFTTGWTLVDIREDPANSENKLLVLVSDNGTVLIKELETDAHSPEYRRLYLQANDPKNKPAMAVMPPGQSQ